MTFETLAPDGIVSQSGFSVSATVGTIDRDANWNVAASNSSVTDIRTTMPLPTGNPTIGAGLQTINVEFRKFSGNTGNPIGTVELWEAGGGALLATASAAITSTVSQVVPLTFDASLLGLASGADVEIVAHGAKVAGSGSVKNALDTNGIEWVVDYTAGADHTGSGAPSLPSLTGSASGTKQIKCSGGATLPALAMATGSGGVLFDGTNDYLSVPNTISADNDVGSIYIKVKVPALGTAGYIFNPGSPNCYIQHTSSGQLKFVWYNTASSAIINISSSSTYSDEEIEIHAVLDASGGVTRLYVNGVQEASTTPAADTLDFTPTNGWFIGSGVNGSTKTAMEFTRACFWDNVALDVTDSAVRADMANTAQASTLGNNVIDFYGVASVWNAGTNNGSGADGTITGSVTDVGGSNDGIRHSTGSGAAILPLLTSTGAGVRHSVGSGTATLPLLTAAGTGSKTTGGTYTGSGAPILPPLTASAAGTRHSFGSASNILPSLIGEANATRTIIGTGTPALPLFTASGAGTKYGAGSHSGTGFPSLPALTSAGTGVRHSLGSGATVLPVLNSSGTGIKRAQGNGAGLLPILAASGVGNKVSGTHTGSGAAILPSLNALGDGVRHGVGSGGGLLPKLEASIFGVRQVVGIAMPILPIITSDANAIRQIKGTAIPVLPSLTITAAGYRKLIGFGAGWLPPFQGSGSGYLVDPNFNEQFTAIPVLVGQKYVIKTRPANKVSSGERHRTIRVN